MQASHFRSAFLSLSAFAAAFALSAPAQGQSTGTAARSPLPIGMSTALAGPCGDLGTHMREGVEAAFAEYNRSLAEGRSPLQLIALDDGYEPDRCAPNMRQLVDKDKVMAVIGNVGTPTGVVAIPIANETGTPFFGAFTGAGVLRKNPPDRYVINYRASYAEETGAMVDALIVSGGLKPEEVAVFTQRDAYGDAGFSGAIAALMRHGLKSESAVTHGRYERNTVAVETGLAEILMADVPPRAVIMVGAYRPCGEFIKQARGVGFNPVFMNVSFVGPNSLTQVLGEAGEGVIVTQVVPHYDSDLPIVQAYRRAMAVLDPKLQFTFGSLEGYVAGRVFCHALGRIEGAPDREKIVDALLGLGKFDLGLGVELELGAGKHQACHEVWPTIIEGGKLIPFQWARLSQIFARG